MLKTFLDYIWIPLFEANLVAVYVVTFLIYSYLSRKPPGHQTVFDFVLCDSIIVIQSTMPIFTNSKNLYICMSCATKMSVFYAKLQERTFDGK